MAGDIISKKTRNEFREYFVGRTLREIEMEFDAADVPCDDGYQCTETGARRSLVERYYHAIDFSNLQDVRKILTVYENVLTALRHQIDNTYNPVDFRRCFDSLTKWLARDGFHYENGRLLLRGSIVSLPTVREAAAALDVPELHRQLDRLRTAVDDDPNLAIGTAKELVETTCKTILTARGVTINDSAEIGELVKTTRQELGLMPDGIPNTAKGAEVIRRLLSNLGTIAQSLGELRNLYGTGHGRTGSNKGLPPRHARLAVGSAATLATFFLETHEARMEKAKTRCEKDESGS